MELDVKLANKKQFWPSFSKKLAYEILSNPTEAH
jgi:hypothetical protein